jgi:endonuclease/exonuclease/phosphatase family metal-dependent hydrolase
MSEITTQEQVMEKLIETVCTSRNPELQAIEEINASKEEESEDTKAGGKKRLLVYTGQGLKSSYVTPVKIGKIEKMEDNLVIFSLNLFFDRHHKGRRLYEVVKFIKREMPHVIALQEVTRSAIEFLVKKLGRFYNFSDDTGSSFIEGYGVAILTKKGIGHTVFAWEQIPTRSGRKILSVQINGQHRLHVLTGHFERGDAQQRQLNRLASVMGNLKGKVIYLGDTNLRNTVGYGSVRKEVKRSLAHSGEKQPKEPVTIPPGLIDAYIMLGNKHEDGYTRNSEENGLAYWDRENRDKEYSLIVRDDRVFITEVPESGGWTITQMEVIKGYYNPKDKPDDDQEDDFNNQQTEFDDYKDDPYEYDDDGVAMDSWWSDHYGLLVKATYMPRKQ